MGFFPHVWFCSTTKQVSLPFVFVCTTAEASMDGFRFGRFVVVPFFFLFCDKEFSIRNEMRKIQTETDRKTISLLELNNTRKDVREHFQCSSMYHGEE